MTLRRVVHGVVLLCLSAWMVVAAVASEYHGQVVFGGQPLPGSMVTVTATQGDKKAVAVSDDQGVFAFRDLADGTWTLTIEMTGFAPLKQQVTIAPNAQPATFELKLLSLDEIRAQDKPLKFDMTQLAAATSSPGSEASGAAGAAGHAAAAPKEGSAGILINGSQSNAATSQFSMSQAFGNNRNRRSLYNGMLALGLENSSLDAKSYSLTGTPAPKPQFNNYTAHVDFGGPLNIPHLMPRGPGFNIFYTHSQNNSYNTQAAKIPTGLDPLGTGNWGLSRGPIFVPAELTQPGITSPGCISALPGATQTDPATGKQEFTNNVIPAACVAPASKVLLSRYPQTPNTNDPVYNYQAQLNNTSAADTLGLYMYKTIGKNNFNGNWNFSDSRNTNPSLFGFVDNGAGLGTSASIKWSRNFSQRVHNTVAYSFSRSRSQSVPYFANRDNIEGTAGISLGPNPPGPAYWGPPSLSFSSGILGLSDGTFGYNRNENNSLVEDVSWDHVRHHFRFEAAYNRLEFNYRTESNPNGQLGFTGAATRVTVGSGSDLADFLLGLPDTSQIAYGNEDKYLRQSTYRISAVDDIRLNELTITPSVTWEYGSPISERNGRLVNLDVGQNFSSANQVTGSNPLVHADYSRPEPSVGISWRPISGSSFLVRSGYGMGNDTSVYLQSALAMSQQAPLSISSSLNSADCAFNIANPFVNGCAASSTADTFALDPNFRVGYVQSWNLSVERDLPFSLKTVVNYDGIKGTHGVQEILPNTCPAIPGNVPTVCNANPHGYIFRTSGGNLEREEGWITLRRRPRNGFEATVTYTFAKSIDDDYALGAQGSVTSGGAIAQQWDNPRGQRGLSPGDQRHKVVVTAQYTTGLGIGGKALLSGWRGAIYKGWSISSIFSAGSGLPETPYYAGATISGSGQGGTLRPNVVGSPYAGLAPGVFLNAAAYSAPAVGAYGNARRNSIEGPDTFSLNATMNRTFRLHGRYSLDATLAANNVLNHVVYTGWNTNWIQPCPAGSTATATTCTSAGGVVTQADSGSFGAPLAVGGMRNVTLNMRMRF